MTKRFTPSQDRFLLYILEEGPTTISSFPCRLRTSGESLTKLGYVEEYRGKYRLTKSGKSRAHLLKLWQERPELKPKRGGTLKKGRISAPLYHGQNNE
jgi:hypothetical protein